MSDFNLVQTFERKRAPDHPNMTKVEIVMEISNNGYNFKVNAVRNEVVNVCNAFLNFFTAKCYPECLIKELTLIIFED